MDFASFVALFVLVDVVASDATAVAMQAVRGFSDASLVAVHSNL